MTAELRDLRVFSQGMGGEGVMGIIPSANRAYDFPTMVLNKVVTMS